MSPLDLNTKEPTPWPPLSRRSSPPSRRSPPRPTSTVSPPRIPGSARRSAGPPDGKGRYNHFEHGSIHWHPAHGAFEVHGAIRDKWAALGYETGWLGDPMSDELQFADGRVSQSNVAPSNGELYFNIFPA